MTLYLIDGSNWIHRAAATGALVDTLSSMVSAFLHRARRPTHVGAFFDSPEPGFRHELYAGYKAGRKTRPSVTALRAEARAVFSDAGITCVDPVVGAEADDMIATASARTAPMRVLIASSDLDFLQLVDQRVFLGVRRQGENVTWRPENVTAAYGVEPVQWPSVLALAGKPTNGIPGLKGIGLKGACGLVSRFGSLEKVLAGWRGVERASYRRALEAHGDVARLYLSLTTLRSDLPIEAELETFERRPWRRRPKKVLDKPRESP